MKKRLAKAIILALLTLTLAACGSSSNSKANGCGDVCHYAQVVDRS